MKHDSTTEGSRLSQETTPPPKFKEYQPPLSDSVLSDPSLLIGLSKAQNNVLSWIAYYNEGEQPALASIKAQSSLPINQTEVLN